MSLFSIRPSILLCDTVQELAEKLHIGKGDVLFTSGFVYSPLIEPARLSCEVMLRDRYGRGDPTDQMIDAIRADLCKKEFRRIIAVGGGAIMDIAKMLVLDGTDSTEAILTGKAHPKKRHELVVVPTTCGSGTEVTDMAMVQVASLRTTVTCQMTEFLPDTAALVPELLGTLTYKTFVTSSMDALVRACEAYLSPQSNAFTDLFSLRAIELIASGYQYVCREGQNAWKDRSKEFLQASCFAGIAFSNTGYGPAYALACPIAVKHQIPSGEVCRLIFREVLRLYRRYKPVGKLDLLEHHLAKLLSTSIASVWEVSEKLLGAVQPYRTLRELGVPHKSLWDCMQAVVRRQQSAMAHAYAPLSENDVLRIYEAVY